MDFNLAKINSRTPQEIHIFHVTLSRSRCVLTRNGAFQLPPPLSVSIIQGRKNTPSVSPHFLRTTAMDTRAENISVKKIASPCDVEALKKCLEENKGEYAKCQAQVEAFKSSCSLKNPNKSSLDSTTPSTKVI